MNDVQALIVYISEKPSTAKPELFTTGGYSVITPDNKEIMFDWLDMSGNFSFLEDGRFKIEAVLEEFDFDYFRESNMAIDGVDKLTVSDLAKLPLWEVYYECVVNCDDVALELVHFELFDKVEKKSYKFDCDNY